MREWLILVLIGLVLLAGSAYLGYRYGYAEGYSIAKAEGGFRIDFNGKPILEVQK